MKSVVTIIPYYENKFLMQLRDDKPNVVFPGQWGFFGGEIENNETPLEAAIRELYEEITYLDKNLIFLYEKQIETLNARISTFYCHLNCDISKLVLKEGMDFKLVDKNEIFTKKIYSNKFKRNFPIVNNLYLTETIDEIIEELR